MPSAGDVRSIHQLLEFNADSYSDSPALLDTEGNSLTHQQMLLTVGQVITQLRSHGIRPSDRVVTVLPNGLHAAIGFLSAAGCAAAVPLNPDLSTSDFTFYLNDLQPSIVLTLQGFETEIRTAASNANVQILELDEEALLSPHPRSDVLQSKTGPAPNAIGLLLYTSGTTARPKRVPLTQAQLLASSGNIARALDLQPEDRSLLLMPLFHIHGLIAGLLASLRVGASVICTPGFDGARILHWLKSCSPTWYTAVPTIHQSLLRVLDEQGVDRLGPNPLRFVRSSSSAMPFRVFSELEQRLGVPVIEAYGMTEATHQISTNPLPPDQRKPGSVGLPTGIEVTIRDSAGAELPVESTGEIALRGPTITTGYEGNPEANDSAFEQGWFRTGDEGKLDADGYLFLTGRIKEMINRGGEKIAPIDVDNELMEHPAVREAVAFAVPHPSLGEDLVAAVVLTGEGESTEEELRSHLLSQLAGFKVPSRILLVDALPKSATGKLRRIDLADRLREHLIPDYEPPQTPIEEALCSIWEEVLKVDRVGRNDNFFVLGGDSLSATRVLTRVNVRMGFQLGIRQVFEFPTLKGQARALLKRTRIEGEPKS